MIVSETAKNFKNWIQDECGDSQIERLLFASLTLFSTKGYMETSVDDIVAMARASKRTFYKHFPSKYDALHQCFRLVASKLQKEVGAILSRPGLDVRTNVRGALSYYVRTLCVDYVPIAKLMLVEVVGISPEFERVRLEYHRRFSEMIQRAITGAMERGEIAEVDPALTSYFAVGAINEIVVRIVQGEVKRDLESVVDYLTNILLKMLT